jgi:hypothetical protein
MPSIILVLLIILTVTSVQIVKASIGVDLPSAAAAGASIESTDNIVIDADPRRARRAERHGGRHARCDERGRADDQLPRKHVENERVDARPVVKKPPVPTPIGTGTRQYAAVGSQPK